jgi:hypothetical protein
VELPELHHPFEYDVGIGGAVAIVEVRYLAEDQSLLASLRGQSNSPYTG